MKKVMAGAMAGALLVAGGLGFAGWKVVNAEEDNANKTVNVSEQKSSKEVERSQVKSTEITMEQAIETAQGEYPGIVTQIELDRDDNRLEYELELYTKDAQYDIHMNANTGKITDVEKDDDDRDERAKAEAAKVSISEAIQIAEKETNGKVVEIELDREDGYLHYEAEVWTESDGKREVHVNAESGKFTKGDDDRDDKGYDDRDDGDDRDRAVNAVSAKTASNEGKGNTGSADATADDDDRYDADDDDHDDYDDEDDEDDDDEDDEDDEDDDDEDDD